MATLTKYDSFEALKANSGSDTQNLAQSNERHLAFEKFMNLLREQMHHPPTSKPKGSSKKDI